MAEKDAVEIAADGADGMSVGQRRRFLDQLVALGGSELTLVGNESYRHDAHQGTVGGVLLSGQAALKSRVVPSIAADGLLAGRIDVEDFVTRGEVG